MISLGCCFSYSKLNDKGNDKGNDKRNDKRKGGACDFCTDDMLAPSSQVIENKKNFQLIVPIA